MSLVAIVQGVIDAIMAEDLQTVPGETFVYSDFGPIILALVVERLSGLSWADFTARRIFGPLRMKTAGFRPTAPFVVRGGADPDPADPEIVPTELDQTFRHRLCQVKPLAALKEGAVLDRSNPAPSFRLEHLSKRARVCVCLGGEFIVPVMATARARSTTSGPGCLVVQLAMRACSPPPGTWPSSLP